MLNIMTAYDTENNRWIVKITIVMDRIRATFTKNATNKRENLSIEKEIDSEGKAKCKKINSQIQNLD